MMQKDVFVGSIVYSKAGRDTGKCYIIVRLEGSQNAYVANGEDRQLAKPKLKNVKHLTVTGEVVKTIAEKLESGKQVFDSEIKSVLRAFNVK